MEIPTPNDYAKDHGHNPFPPRWERWLSSVREAILTSQPTAGRHVSIDEHPGKGTVINVERRPGAAGAPGTGACCDAENNCTITTEADCIAAGGSYQGDDTICDPNPCLGCQDTPFICATFSDIVGCTCVSIGTKWYSGVDVSLNGSFEMHLTSSGGGVSQWEGVGGALHIKRFPNNSCSTPEAEFDCNTTLILQCIGPPTDPTHTSHYLGYNLDGFCTISGVVFWMGVLDNGQVPFGSSEDSLSDCIDTSQGNPFAKEGSVSFAAGGCAGMRAFLAPPAKWPLILQPLKLLAQPGDKGAGDIIERTIGPLGGNAFKTWYETTFGRPCGCSVRKEHWNQSYPLKP